VPTINLRDYKYIAVLQTIVTVARRALPIAAARVDRTVLQPDEGCGCAYGSLLLQSQCKKRNGSKFGVPGHSETSLGVKSGSGSMSKIGRSSVSLKAMPESAG
jgi:hypothetical protein